MLAPQDRLVQAVNQEFAASQTSQLKRLGTLIVELAQDGLRFVEATLLPPDVRLAVGGHAMPASAFRRQQEPTEAVAYVRALPESTGTVLLKVQIRRQGKPLVRRRVSLSSPARTVYSRNTSTEGEVDFPRLLPGDYTINIPRENVATQLIIQSIQEETRGE